MTDAAKSAVRARSGGTDSSLESWLALGLFNRCITYGVPNAIFPAAYNANTRIVQAPGYVSSQKSALSKESFAPSVAFPLVH